MNAVRSFAEKLLQLGRFITVEADARTMAAHSAPASQKILEEKSAINPLVYVYVLVLIKPVLQVLWKVIYLISNIFFMSLMFTIPFFLMK